MVESKPSSSPPPLKKYQSCAKAVKASTRISLLHDDLICPAVDDETQVSTFQSRVFRSSRCPNTFLLDISPVKHDYNKIAAEDVVNQHPQVYAYVPASDSPKYYLEVYAADQVYLQDHGLLFSKFKLRVLSLLSSTGFFQNFQFSPLWRPPLLDVDILTNPKTKHFIGLGYAVLDTSHCSVVVEDDLSPKPYPLTHVINWCEEDDSFLTTWNNTPTWCQYCHKERHTKFECGLSKAQLICHDCQQKGYRSFECPPKKPAFRRFS
ncbi:MAG: hypothetical protein EXX96DRAFT_482955 [Benjaminiella poitrasii]|nr:MAG: hypothetical protein EXX96DRAFT_482955 [Benjaminiella poitrasii]